MKTTKTFLIIFGILIILFFLPQFITKGAPAYDGQRSYGFPLTYRTYGGLCVDGPCGYFSYVKLVTDLIIIAATPYIISLIIFKFKKKKMNMFLITEEFINYLKSYAECECLIFLKKQKNIV